MMNESVCQSRLEMLADLWGKIYLFHPNLLHRDLTIDWNQAFLDVFPLIEEAQGTSELLEALNNVLFRPLQDPLTFAQATVPEDDGCAGAPGASGAGISCSHFSGCPDLDYIRLVYPELFARHDFLGELQSALCSASNGRGLILDLRWSRGSRAGIAAQWLGVWVKTICLPTPVFRRVHYGWHELHAPYIYRQGWEVEAGISLSPILKTTSSGRPGLPDPDEPASSYADVPTLILVNNNSVLHVGDALSVLSRMPRVRVIWQRTGRFSIPSSKSLRYAEGIEAHVNLATAPSWNTIRHREITEEELPDLFLQSMRDNPPDVDSSFRYQAALRFDATRRRAAILSRAGRLLDLVKMRTVLASFYPYLERAGLQADHILRRYAPKVAVAQSRSEHYLALSHLASELRDSHAGLVAERDESVREALLPATFAWVEGRAFVSQADRAVPLSPGDEVLEIDGSPMPQVMDSWRDRISASSEQAFIHAFLDRIRLGEAGRRCTLTIGSGSDAHRVVLEFCSQAAREGNQAQAGIAPPLAGLALAGCSHALRLLDDGLAYMMPFEFPDLKTLDRAFQIIRTSPGLILDLRGYPKCHFQQALVRRLCGYPVKSPRYETRIGQGWHPCEARWLEIRYQVSPEDEDPPAEIYTNPIVALISEETQSSAEDLCMYLRIARRVTFVGRTTAGCQGNASWILLPSGAHVSFTGMRVSWPDGTPFQGAGIIPDLSVPPNLQALVENRDEILERGVDVLRGLVKR